MTFTAFASGSSGNCSLISERDTHILIDAGISLRRIRMALVSLGLQPEDLQGVLITHEHSDHISGVPMLTKHCGLPLFAPCAAATFMSRADAGVEAYMHRIGDNEVFTLGSLRIRSFPTPHDAVCSVGYRFESESGVFGYCTDCGSLTDEVYEGLHGCNAAVIESNHDEELLRYGRYSIALKRRILSDRGHLSNESCASLAVTLAESGCRSFILGHLSRENNRPALAYDTVRSALDRSGFEDRELQVAPPLGAISVEVAGCCV